MAKTIMISNGAYEELKALKGERSFSEVIMGLVSTDRKKGTGLRECLGILKEDEDWKKVKKELKRGWEKWTKEYA